MILSAFVFLGVAAFLEYEGIGSGLPALINLCAAGLYFYSRSLRRDDGIDASKLAYSKSERSHRTLWLAASYTGLVLMLAGGALWIFFSVPGGYRAMTPMQWAEIGAAIAFGALLLAVAERVLVALALAVAQREGRGLTS